MAIVVVLAFASAAFANEEKVILSLGEVPSFSLSTEDRDVLLKTWTRELRVFPKKTTNFFVRQPMDAPGAAMRLQLLRFDAVGSGNILPALNPEVFKKNP